MQRPRLTLACELDRRSLAPFFSDDSVIDDLVSLEARVALMLSDFSSERAAVVQRLNAAKVPVVAIPLLPLEDGYYFTTDNAPQAAARYEQWTRWTLDNGLLWHGVGLDIEPDARIYRQVMDNPWGLIPLLLPRLLNGRRVTQARDAYQKLVRKIQADGWVVENYQFPLIADERRTRSTLLQRLALVDVRTDKEVWMLYSSFMRKLGPGLIWSYGPEAPAIGVGTTGGGPDIPGSPQMPVLSWDELARDLRLAGHWSSDVLIHSLEGCVEQGFLGRLRSFDWSHNAGRPRGARLAASFRRLLTLTLWICAHPWAVLSAGGAALWLQSRQRRA